MTAEEKDHTRSLVKKVSGGYSTSRFDAEGTQHIAMLRVAYGLKKSGDDVDFFGHEDDEEAGKEDADEDADDDAEEDDYEDADEDAELKEFQSHLLPGFFGPIDQAIPFFAEVGLGLSILGTDAISFETDAIPAGLLNEDGLPIL
jgi:hypothetical protein